MTKKNETDLVVANNFEMTAIDEKLLAMMDEDAENYVDETNVEDIAIPRLTLLQSSSKPCKKADAEYVKGAEEGDLFETLSKTIYKGDDGCYFVPAKRRVVYIHWTDIEAGGGMIENFGEDPTEYMKVTPNEKGKRRTSETTEIVKTHEVFGYLVDPVNKSFKEVIMSLASTQEKKMKRLNALIRSLVSSKTGNMLPEYAGVYKITSTPESNDKNSWFTYEFSSAGFTLALPDIGPIIYKRAKDFAESIKNGEVNVKYEEEMSSEVVDEETETDLM